MTFHNVIPGNTWNYTYSDYNPFITHINAITNAQKAVVTVDETPQYSVGEILSFRVSPPYGMTEINNASARVLEIDGNDITLEIDTLGLNPFVYPPVGTVVQPALLVPAGSGIVPDSPIPMTDLSSPFDNAPN